jgi:alginate O-acetyltransferase complex protein AlgI
MIEKATGHSRKLFLVISIVANVGVLAFFKYYNFFIDNINQLFSLSHLSTRASFLNIVLPIGLSFHTFQAMSYTIEVYRGNQKAEKHLGIYALYVMFYPQLVAGPIERPQNVLHQFHEKHRFTYEDAVAGSRLILWGMLKKVVVADRLALITDPIFNNPHGQSGTTLAIASIFFAFQIFCDFSGYSDIALGTARFMGFKLMTNFNKPYHSRNIAEFWKRWHISLSTWFRDYLYIPLGGNRVSKARSYFNQFFVFMVSGFWHGANWTFICWGSLHGLYLITARLTKDSRNKAVGAIGLDKVHWLHNMLNVLFTFCLATLAWIFFRANNVHDAIYIINRLTYIPSEMAQVVRMHKLYFLHLPGLAFVFRCFLLIAGLEIAHILSVKYKLDHTFSDRPTIFRWSLYFAGIACFFLFGVFEKHSFIYFQF